MVTVTLRWGPPCSGSPKHRRLWGFPETPLVCAAHHGLRGCQDNGPVVRGDTPVNLHPGGEWGRLVISDVPGTLHVPNVTPVLHGVPRSGPGAVPWAPCRVYTGPGHGAAAQDPVGTAVPRCGAAPSARWKPPGLPCYKYTVIKGEHSSSSNPLINLD